MGTVNAREVAPKVWEDQEYGVLPIFCYNVQKDLGDEISLHFFEPRYLRLLRIVCESTQSRCFIYTSTGHPQIDTTAFICSITTIQGSNIQGTMTNIAKINQSWIDKADRLWWCRFQVVKINPIPPLLQLNCSPNFKCVRGSNQSNIPVLMFLNHDLPTESETCDFYYNPAEEIRMYSIMCTATIKQAIIKAAANETDPEYTSLRNLPGGTIWYLLPEHSQKGMDCRALAKYVETWAKEVTGSTTRDDLISMLVELEVSCVKNIRVPTLKARIKYGADHIVRCPMSQQVNRPSFVVSVDFGITTGNFVPFDVSLTPGSSKRILQQVSRKVNQERLRLLNCGHGCSDSPLKKLPTQIIDKVKSFLIYL